jgi:4-amino-4-deoxychorismate lyase
MAERVLVTLDGDVLNADAPLLHADDLAALRGDGVFETLLVRRGNACNLEAHLKRLAESAEALDLPRVDPAEWRTAVGIAAFQWGGLREGLMRLVYSRGRESGPGATAYVMVSPLPTRVTQARQRGISAITLERGYSTDVAANAPWLLLGAKTLSYAVNMAALRYANSQGADDVVFLSSDGYVLEGPRSTVVIARDKTLLTPPTEQGILPGTTQRALFDIASDQGYDVGYSPLYAVDLLSADGVWLLSSVTLGARIHTLNGVRMPEPAIASDITRLIDLAIEPNDRAEVSA